MYNKHQKPIILYEGHYSASDLATLKKSNRIWQMHDIYRGQLKELFEIAHPSSKTAANYQKITDDTLSGNWIYYPWSGVLVHMLPEREYHQLRTNRNRELITQAEQKKLLDFTVGFVGLSIGNASATALAYNGIGRQMKLAEYDALDTTNLNRIRARLDQIGIPKIDITIQQIYEINPYADLSLFCDGLNKNNLADFFKTPKPRVILEAIDDFEMKVHLRLWARKFKIPVIMFSNLGDSVLIDVERYDLKPRLPLFNGLIGKVPEQILNNPDVTPAMKHKYAVELVGKKNVPLRALKSVKAIGKTLVGRPQLMSTVTISSGAAAFLVRRIALGEPVPSGRRLVKFSEAFL